MDPMTTGLVAMQVLGGISGLLGSASARKRAIQARERALQEMMRQLAMTEEAQQRNNARSLYQTSGLMGDALQAQAGALGSAMAQAGVYNSSATAGALQKQARDNAAILADLAARNQFEMEQLRSKNQQYITSQRLGFAQQDYEEAKAAEAGSVQGIIEALKTAAQAGAQRNNKTTTRAVATEQPKNVAQQTAGDFSEFLRRLTNMKTSQTYGPVMNGAYNATLPQLPPLNTYAMQRQPWWFRSTPLFGR